MASIKTITKKLVDAGYSENKLILMTEKDIRAAYKEYKNSLKEENSKLSTPNVTVNNTVMDKEETIMKTRTTQELLNDALTITKIQDKNYVTNAMLRDEYNKITGEVIGSKKTRPVIIKAIQDAISTPEETVVTPEVVSVGDLEITSDVVYHDDTIIEKPVKPVPNDAMALTYRLMHKIGDHALKNRKKGFGTTVSAKMLCAFIVEVASLNDPEPIHKLYVPSGKKDSYGKDITMINPRITDEHKNKCKEVRNWLLNNHYIEVCTFKDEKGFVFYTPEYDGNRQNSMYDATKFQSTGKTETTTYRITKEMNKWYTK